MDSELHVVFGASGGAGEALVHELVSRGRRVRAVSRGGRGNFPAGVEFVRADALNPAEARRAAEGAAVVYHCVNVPYPEWHRKLMPLMESLIAAAEAAGARLVYADNLYMYGAPDGPLSEDTPERPNTRKGALRSKLGQALLGAHAEGRVRAAIARGSDFYGPGPLNAVAGTRLFEAVLNGRKATWIGRLDVPHSLTYIGDFARVLATLGERDEALGGVWHTPADEPLTGRRFIELAFREASRPPRVGAISTPMVKLAGVFVPFLRELGEMMYQFDRPFVIDGSRFRHTFGFEPTPNDEGVRRTLEWYRSRPG